MPQRGRCVRTVSVPVLAQLRSSVGASAWRVAEPAGELFLPPGEGDLVQSATEAAQGSFRLDPHSTTYPTRRVPACRTVIGSCRSDVVVTGPVPSASCVDRLCCVSTACPQRRRTLGPVFAAAHCPAGWKLPQPCDRQREPGAESPRIRLPAVAAAFCFGSAARSTAGEQLQHGVSGRDRVGGCLGDRASQALRSCLGLAAHR